MSTEQKKDLPTSEAAQRLSNGWEQFRKGNVISYKVMAIILLVVTGIGVYFYIRSEGRAADSKKWTELEGANDVKKLEEFAKAYPNTVSGKVAELHLARYLLGPDGIEALSTRDEGRRRKAVENIEKARGMFEKIAEEMKDYPLIKAECYLGCAKAEEALIGITKEGKIDEFRGSIDKLIEWLNKLAETAPDTAWGTDAKEFAEQLKTPAKRDELTRTQVSLYRIEPPLPPPGSPLIPGEGPRPGGVPGLPGGPIAPTGPAPTPGPTPPAPPTTPPAPPTTPPAPPTTPPAPPTTPPTNPTPPAPKPPEPPKTPTTTPPTTPPTNPTPPAPKPPEPPKK